MTTSPRSNLLPHSSPPMLRSCLAAGSSWVLRTRGLRPHSASKAVAFLRHRSVSVVRAEASSSSRTIHSGASGTRVSFTQQTRRRSATTAAAAKFSNAFAVLELPVPDFNSQDKSKHLTEQDVKKAFRAAAIRTHPDRGGTATAFRAATDAYEECLRIVLARQSGARVSQPDNGNTVIVVVLAVVVVVVCCCAVMHAGMQPMRPLLVRCLFVESGFNFCFTLRPVAHGKFLLAALPAAACP